MTPEQRIAIEQHCRFAFETAQAQFCHRLKYGASLVLTVNSGYEWIEEGFGGPVWHASVAGPALASKVRRRLALQALHGVGNAVLQWEHDRPTAYHVRRRLLETETVLTGPVCDLRGSAESWERFERIKARLPAVVHQMAKEELTEHART